MWLWSLLWTCLNYKDLNSQRGDAWDRWLGRLPRPCPHHRGLAWLAPKSQGGLRAQPWSKYLSRLQEGETGWNQENKSGWKWPSGTSWWSSVEDLLSNPGDAGLIPGQGTKIPRASGQLSPCCVCNKRSPCTTTWDSVRETTKTQHSKNKERTFILSNVAFEISMEPCDSSSNILFPHFVCLMTYITGLPPLRSLDLSFSSPHSIPVLLI